MILEQKNFFDEHAYLAANPDVASAVSGGTIKSGWLHFLQFGIKEGRAGVKVPTKGVIERVYNLPLLSPPAHLVSRVHGVADLISFNATGRMLALDIFRYLQEHMEIKTINNVFEFGCGCGRVLYPLSTLLPQAKLFGSDIDKEAIGWLNEARSVLNLNSVALFNNGDMPPLSASTEAFDLVYAISVFTHLPVPMQDAWMTELCRITKKGSYLLITTQNESLILQHLDESDRAKLMHEGVFYKAFQSTTGLPDYYQASWHVKGYLEKRWSDLVELVCHVPHGIGGHQDLNLYRRR